MAVRKGNFYLVAGRCSVCKEQCFNWAYSHHPESSHEHRRVFARYTRCSGIVKHADHDELIDDLA